MIGGNRECGCRLFAAGVKKARLASLSDLKGNLFVYLAQKHRLAFVYYI